MRPADTPRAPTAGGALAWPGAEPNLAADAAHSIRNAVKLGASLVVTWGVALGVRLLLPRHLGPETFGAFQFADAYTAAFFVLAQLGVDTYVRKEVATRREHASDFFGGTLVLRLAVSAIVVAVMGALLSAAGRPAAVHRLVLLFALAQLFVTLNTTYAALLHAVGQVDALALLNVGSKLLWGVGIVAGLSTGHGVESVALALAVSEALKTAALAVLARRHVGLVLRVDLAKTWPVLVASLPFYLNYLAHTAYAKLDVSLMSFLLSRDDEVGWYGAASNLSGLALLLTPLITWVLLPMTSRAAARSEAELTTLTRRAIELILVVAIPVTLLLGLGAAPFVALAFGPAFAPATRSVQVLAPMFVLTYVAMVSSTVLIRLGRGWTVTLVSLSGLVLNPLLNVLLIPYAYRTLGPGGAGVGAAASLIATEAFVTGVLTALIGRRAFDRRTLVMLGKTVVVCVVVVALDRALASLGPVRLLADASAYFALVLAWRAVPLDEAVELVTLSLRRRPTE